MRDAGDVFQYRNNLQRVFVTLLDGKWHGAIELQRVGGQNFGARVRELREERCGALTVDCRKAPKGRGSQYRIDVRQVSKATQEMILGGNVPPRKRASKTCPQCSGAGKIPKVRAEQTAESFDPPAQHVASVPIDTTKWNDVFDELAS